MNQDIIDYVITIAECKSISAAAELLYVSQPSLSRSLSHLESELGVKLFIRTPKGTELTEVGRIYLEYAQKIQVLRKETYSKIKELSQEKNRIIRVGMTLNSASLSSVNVEKEVKKQFPNCDVKIYNIFSKDIEKALKEKIYDFAIGPNCNYSHEFKYRVLRQEPYILLVPQRYDISKYKIIDKESPLPLVNLCELPTMDYVFQDEETFVRKEIDRILQSRKLEIKVKTEVTSSLLAVQAAENKIGCCIVALGHLPYIKNGTKLKAYRIIGNELSAAGLVSLKSKSFSAFERYCIEVINRALLEGEKEIYMSLGAMV